jgi:hypothetical protein
MKVNFPLDLPADCHGVARALPSSQLQNVILKALRLEHNWQHDVSYIRWCRKLPIQDDGLVVSKMRLVTPSCLAYLSRYWISVWNIEHAGHLVASLKTHGTAVMFPQIESELIIVAVVEYRWDVLPTRRECVIWLNITRPTYSCLM